MIHTGLSIFIFFSKSCCNQSKYNLWSKRDYYFYSIYIPRFVSQKTQCWTEKTGWRMFEILSLPTRLFLQVSNNAYAYSLFLQVINYTWCDPKYLARVKRPKALKAFLDHIMFPFVYSCSINCYDWSKRKKGNLWKLTKHSLRSARNFH